MGMFSSRKVRRSGVIFLIAGVFAATFAMACETGGALVERIVEVPVEKIITREIIKEIPVEKIVIQEVEKIVTREVPVEVEKIVERVVEKIVTRPVEKIVTVEVTPVPKLPEPPKPQPAAKPAPNSKNPRGEIVFVASSVSGATGSGFNAGALCCYNKQMGVTETLWRPTNEDSATPLIAEKWEIASDALSATVTIKTGIPFHSHHGDFGDLTAEDVVWSFNDTNPNLSETLGSGLVSITDGSGSWAGFLGADKGLEVLGPDSLRINWPAFDPRWQTWFFGQDGLAASIVSKKAFDTKGKDWNTDHMVGTGPFMMTKWVRGDRVEVTAVANHWRKTPEITKLTMIAVPDETVRQAMMKTGEADVGDIGLRNIGEMERNGMTSVTPGVANMWSVMFAGNLWEEFHPTTGEKLEIVTVIHDIPWIGNPSWGRAPRDNNPPGMTDMEQARLVRLAMSMAIDRDEVNEVVFGGLGWPVYNSYFDINNPNWNDKWKVPYDPAGAEALLDKAGFPRNDDGIRFQAPFYSWEIFRSWSEIGDAVAAYWEDIGIDVEVLHFAYAVWRPNLVAKSATAPYIDGCAVGCRAASPWDWPRESQASALARGGKSNSIEINWITEYFQKVSAEPSRAKRIELNNELADLMHHWVPSAGTVAQPLRITINPKTLSWPVERGLRFRFNSPENIVLK
jgi:ABC-type transport system substrate-binding protein